MPAAIITEQAGFQIRSSRPEDAEGVMALASLPGFRFGTLRLPHQTLEQTRNWLATETPDSMHLLAVLDGKVIGQAGLRRFAGRRAHAAGLGLGVHDDYLGRGVGSALMRELVDVADKWLDIRRLELTVFTDNAAAITLYRKFGFEVEGTHRAYAFRDGRHVDALAMARLRGI
ncbi:MAG: L-amino acid N-acetyltransferase AaaT [Herbaspirillum frisingense]|uniref:L-amino acid N-acetyltransferase AaaT n=1 Tax=Herbaspirillum frisingense TaxID=92645 RepID=A0A7V8FVM8_9BURK|nr:MAG: L-amino acid N-acetyltransferase AaaT [Herbaspirillum frisingense]